MNELKIFEHPKFGRIRTIVEDGKTLFCGADAARALGYKNPNDALIRHCKGVVKRDTPTSSGMQSMNFVTEGDLCRLAAKSELPGAGEFESWIFDEVIPSVLRTGTYSVASALPHRVPEISPGGLAKLILATRKVMLEAGSSPLDVREATKSIYETWCIPVPPVLSKQLPGQFCLFGPAGTTI